jgi:hypothetical protein
MQFRNLYRVFVINKAVLGWSKGLPVEISDGQISLLIAISTRDSFSLVELREYMKRFKRTMSDNVLICYLKELVNVGYLDSFGYWPVRYRLSVTGRNALKDLEKRCRETRVDK